MGDLGLRLFVAQHHVHSLYIVPKESKLNFSQIGIDSCTAPTLSLDPQATESLT